MEYAQKDDQIDNTGQATVRLLNALIGLTIAAIFVLLFLTFAGYGTVQLQAAPGDVITTINGHRITQSNLKLRPGDYTVIATSPRFMPDQQALHVSMIKHSMYKPVLLPRDPNAITSSVIGAVPGGSQAPQLVQARWFDNQTWLAGHVVSSGPIALKYDSGKRQWSVGYFAARNYPSSLGSLPSDVSAYIQQLGGS